MYMALATLAILDLCANCNLHAYGLANEQAPTASPPSHTHVLTAAARAAYL